MVFFDMVGADGAGWSGGGGDGRDRHERRDHAVGGWGVLVGVGAEVSGRFSKRGMYGTTAGVSGASTPLPSVVL